MAMIKGWIIGLGRAAAWAAVGLAAGCGTTRLTDTQRTATEQLLVSNAIDEAVSELDFNPLAGQMVYFDSQYIDGTVDRGYLVSSLRHQLLAHGCLLQEDRAKATYVVEARSGSVGTNRHAVLVGIPQMNVPTFVPGQPSQIPEIPFAKTTDQEGVSKVAVFAYNRVSGELVWQSGIAKARSTAKDTWVFGAGPFQQGTIRGGSTKFAGEQLPLPGSNKHEDEEEKTESAHVVVPLTQSAAFRERFTPSTDLERLAKMLSDSKGNKRLPTADQDLSLLRPRSGSQPAKASDPPKVAAANYKPAPPPSASAESEPGKIMDSGLGSQPGNSQGESEPRMILDTPTGMKPDGP